MKDFQFYHPYTRYGFAVALHEYYYRRKKKPHEVQAKQFAVALYEYYEGKKISEPEDNDGKNMSEILMSAIESGLSDFRYRTENNPEIDDVLVFEPIGLSELRKNPDLVQSSGLSTKGLYLAPTILSTDREANKTFNNAEKIISLLKEQKNIFKTKLDASRSFAPTTAKINNGKSSQSPPEITLLEAACSMITTITPLKPSFLLIGDMQYTGIIPDLSIKELFGFISFFDDMVSTHAGTRELNSAKINKSRQSDDSMAKEGKKKKKETIGYRRPRKYDGNYPYAPYDNSAFGALGIIAAIGKWGSEAENREKYVDVLHSLTGNEHCPPAPLYIVSYDKISQAHYGHHIAQLAIGTGVGQKLCDIVLSLTRDTVLYSEIDSNSAKYDNQNYKLFNIMTNRFLQQFNSSGFQDFLAFRAEYSTIIQPLFDRYFMSEENISQEIVTSARAFGQWLNRAAWITAVKMFEDDKNITPEKREEKERKEKAKILAEFESTVMSSKSKLEILANISIRAGRYLQSDAPPEVAEFYAAAATTLKIEQVRHLIIAYSRLSTKREKQQAETENNQVEQENSQVETQEN